MDKDLLQTKLQMLSRCLERIKSQHVESLEDLETNLDKQEIIILNLQRAVQVCIDIGNHILLDYSVTPATMAGTFKFMYEKGLITESCSINLAHVVAFRNIAVHQYDVLDNSIIFSVIKEHLSDFTDFAQSVCKHA